MTLGEHSKRTDNPRRVNRLHERDDDVIALVLPEGSRRIQLGDHWLQEIMAHPDYAKRRPQFRVKISNVALALLSSIEWITGTSTPGNDWLMATAGVRSNALGRVKSWLKRHGFLAMVANGRSAIYTPASSDGFSHLISGDRVPFTKMADRAVFVLCLPKTPEEIAAALEEQRQSMENKGKLAPMLDKLAGVFGVSRNPIQPERKTNPKARKEFASLTGKAYWEAVARASAEQSTARTDLRWPRTGTTSAPDEATRSFNELQAARRVISEAPSLRTLSDRHVARLLAPAFRAGYTPADIIEVFRFMPDGTAHRHDGFTGTINIAAMVQSRLNHWKMNGQYMYSPSQREDQRVRDARARAYKAKPQVKEVSTDDSVFNTGIAMLRNAIRGSNPLDG